MYTKLSAISSHEKTPGRAAIKRVIQDGDRIFLDDARPYTPETVDHQRVWPKIVAAVGQRGAWYSTLRTLCGPNNDYIVYLIGDLGVLKCPVLRDRSSR